MVKSKLLVLMAALLSSIFYSPFASAFQDECQIKLTNSSCLTRLHTVKKRQWAHYEFHLASNLNQTAKAEFTIKNPLNDKIYRQKTLTAIYPDKAKLSEWHSIISDGSMVGRLQRLSYSETVLYGLLYFQVD